MLPRTLRYTAFPLLAMLVAGCATVKVFPEPERVVVAPAPDDGVIVQPGDTLFGIAARYRVGVADLAGRNGLAAPFIIHPGQRLRLAARAQAAPSGAVSSSVRSGSHGSAAAHTPTWRWPAEGAVIVRESNAMGARGIEILGAAGAPVRAAADGVVLYSGQGSTGYEEMIVIQHAGDWVSTYAHNRERLVPEARHVRAGERIAKMGRTGTTRDMLSFELRHNGIPVDPIGQLPAR